MGLTIKIYLADGEPSGIRTAQISNSTIQAIAFRKSQFEQTRKQFPEIERPGAYILIGAEDQMHPVAYIGESESVGARLARHSSKHNGQDTKSFWSDTVVIISKDDNLTKSHARYIEACLIRSTQGNVRWSYPNAQQPSADAGKLPKPEREEMDVFVDQAKTLVGVLGWDLLRDLRQGAMQRSINSGEFQNETKIDASIFHFRGEGFSAEMSIGSTGDCVVKSKSMARARTTPTFPPSAAILRTALIEKGILREIDGALVFGSDYSFATPSAAAAVVMGASANGRVLWKLADGRTYADWEADKAAQSGAAS